MALAIELFQREGFSFLFRWLHILFGIAWIGLLYYFNFVQVPSFAKMEASARTEAIDVLARNALWWFRWASVATVLTGLLIMGITKDYFNPDVQITTHTTSILTGVFIAVIMFLNVWGVIWRNQKVVLANAVAVKSGGQPLPEAAAAGRAAFLASRQNTLFSLVMVWFMTFTTHFSGSYADNGNGVIYWIVFVVIIGALELNALGLIGGKGPGPLKWPYESVQNVLISGFALWFVFWILWEILFAP